MSYTCKSCGVPKPYQLKVPGTNKRTNRRYCINCAPLPQQGKIREHYRTIDGTEHKHCKTCDVWKPLGDFYHYNSRAGNKVSSTQCRECKKRVHREAWQALKQKIVDYKGNKCLDCSLSFPAFIYDFHHRDPAQKDIEVGRLFGKSWTVIQQELDKCDLLCSHCHRTRHFNSDNLSHLGISTPKT